MNPPRRSLDQGNHPYRPGPAPLRSTSAEQVPRTMGTTSRQQMPPPKQRRPLIEPGSPTELPQDNAFPVFPTKKKAAVKPKGDERRGVMSNRSSAEQSHSSGGDPRQHYPNTSAENLSNGSGQFLQRPPMPPPINSFDEVVQYARDERGPRRGSPRIDDHPRGDYGMPPQEYNTRSSAPTDGRGAESHQMGTPRMPQARNQSIPTSHRMHEQRQAQPPARGYPEPPRRSPEYGYDGQGPLPGMQSSERGSFDSRDNARPTVGGRPGMRPIDVVAAHGPVQSQLYSPVTLPMRPATATSSRQNPGPESWESNGYEKPAFGDAQGPPRQQANHRPKQSSLSEMYADYYSNDLIRSPEVGTLDRDAEIEAEMPDFDNGGPLQGAHKRGLTVDHHLAAASASAESLPPPLPSLNTQQVNGFYQHESQAMSQPNIRQGGAKQGGFTNGYVFEVPQSPNFSMPGNRSNPTSPQYQGPPSNQFPGPNQPPSGPYAGPQYPPNDPRNRGRLPPSQPGQQIRGPASAQRPEFDRLATAQTQMSDPGPGRRAPSAPAPGRAYQGPSPVGAPLTQQRSAPSPHAQQAQPAQNPDALPAHPPPVRPGLMNQSSPPAAKPVPIRQYNGAPSSSHQSTPSRSSIDDRRRSQTQPVTLAEIGKLQAQVNAHPQDYKTGLLLAKKLVEASNVLASENGRLDAKTTAKNREKYIYDAHRRIKKLVSQGYPEAMFYLADCYGQGMLGLEVDTKEAFNLYQQAAKAGHGPSAYRTAVCCEMGPEEGGGTRRDIQKAVQWYRRAAQLQDVPAMYKLGVILLKGLLGQQKNIGEAETWLKRAAERADKANPHALHELGVLYEPNNLDPVVRAKIIPDQKYSCELFKRAAGLGYKTSQLRLGQAYEYGALGLPIDARSSIAWYSKGAAQGEHSAELALSGWYLTGAEGILEHSDTEAYLWARKAASSEPPLAKAMFAMGYYTETGIGCPSSVEEAKKWYGRAAAYKFPKAIERLEELKRGGGAAKGGKGVVDARGDRGRLTRKDQKRDEAECAMM